MAVNSPTEEQYSDQGRTLNRGRFGAAEVIAHVLAALSIIMLAVPAVGWLVDGVAIAAVRFGVEIDTDGARQLASMAALFKGILDVVLVPLAILFAIRRDAVAAAATWFLAAVSVAGVDIVLATTGQMTGGVVIHVVYLALLLSTTCAYVFAHRQRLDNKDARNELRR